MTIFDYIYSYICFQKYLFKKKLSYEKIISFSDKFIILTSKRKIA